MRAKRHLLIIGAMVLLGLRVSESKPPADIAHMREEFRQSTREEIAKVVKEPERVERISKIAEACIPLLEQIQQDRAAYLKEFHDVDARYNSTMDDYRLVFQHLREIRNARVADYVAIREKMRSEMTPIEWAKLVHTSKNTAALLRISTVSN